MEGGKVPSGPRTLDSNPDESPESQSSVKELGGQVGPSESVGTLGPAGIAQRTVRPGWARKWTELILLNLLPSLCGAQEGLSPGKGLRGAEVSLN